MKRTRDSQADRDVLPSGRYRFQPRAFPLDGESGRLELAEALSRLRLRRMPVLLDSAAGAPRRFSLLGFDPLPDPPTPPASLRGLERWMKRLEPVGSAGSGSSEDGDVPLPTWFHGGFLGALAYDLGVEGDPLPLPDDPWNGPRLVGGLFVDFIVRDEERGESVLVLGREPGDGRPPVEQRQREIQEALARPFPAPTEPAPAGPLVRTVTGAEYREQVRRVRSEIAKGEIYQANLSQRFRRSMRGDPVDLYLRLRALHPAPYAGFLRFDGGALLSVSPELLLEVRREDGGLVAETRPIKGTAPRGATPELDRALSQGLLSSEKDLAELAMIVDLERNDLGRVAAPDGVRVTAFPRLESYATVHHLVADVRARLREGRSALDALASLFPGGSITGAPKLRSMEVIGELEEEGRGFAFGSLAMVDLRGTLAANLLIRTQVWRDRPELGRGAGEVSYRVGGGVTWASDPAAEEEETRIKGEALARALEGELGVRA